jgi:hypothetical protein
MLRDYYSKTSFLSLRYWEIEPRASHMLDKHSTTWAIPLALLFVYCFWDLVLITLPWLIVNLGFSYFCLLSSWNYRCVPSHWAIVGKLLKGFGMLSNICKGWTRVGISQVIIGLFSIYFYVPNYSKQRRCKNLAYITQLIIWVEKIILIFTFFVIECSLLFIERIHVNYRTWELHIKKRATI